MAQRTVAEAAPIVEALEEYAQALSAIVDATDRVALEKAQGDLKEKVVRLAERADASGQGTAAGKVGAVVGLFNQVAAADLDRRRYEALRAGVVGADSAVAELGPVVGKALALLSAARVALVRDEAQTLEDGLSGPAVRALSEEQYRERMDALDAKADEIRSLITADPETAARKMVEAHARLREALEAPSPQVEAVFNSIKTFVEEARAVRAALADEPETAGKGA